MSEQECESEIIYFYTRHWYVPQWTDFHAKAHLSSRLECNVVHKWLIGIVECFCGSINVNVFHIL